MKAGFSCNLSLPPLAVPKPPEARNDQQRRLGREDQEIPVAGEDHVGIGKHDGSQHPRIIRITDIEGQHIVGPLDHRMIAQECFDPIDLVRVQLKGLTAVLLLATLDAAAQAQAPGSVRPSVSSSPEELAAVRNAVLVYVERFYEGDTTKLVRSVRADVHKLGYFVPQAASQYTSEVMLWPEFISYARGVKERNRQAPPTAPKDIVVFDVQDQTASAKLAAFWGTDYLPLGKYDGKWMITQVLWQSPPRER